MYNGIGLQTARGSGTNGYVVKNKSSINHHRRQDQNNDSQNTNKLLPNRKPDESILLHEKKRKIEATCMDLRVKLEDEGLDEDEIDDKVDQLRQKLLAEFKKGLLKEKSEPIAAYETHKLAQAKLQQNQKMMKALGIREDRFEEGAIFDREKIENDKLVRATERELRNAKKQEREEIEAAPIDSFSADSEPKPVSESLKKSKLLVDHTKQYEPTPSSESRSSFSDKDERNTRSPILNKNAKDASRPSSLERRGRKYKSRSPSPLRRGRRYDSRSRSPVRRWGRRDSRSPSPLRRGRRYNSRSRSPVRRDRSYSRSPYRTQRRNSTDKSPRRRRY